MRVIGILLAAFLYLLGIHLIGGFFAIFVVLIFAAMGFQEWAGVIVHTSPAILALLYALLLWSSDSLMIYLGGYRQPFKKEQEHLKETGVLDLLKNRERKSVMF